MTKLQPNGSPDEEEKMKAGLDHCEIAVRSIRTPTDSFSVINNPPEGYKGMSKYNIPFIDYRQGK